MDSMGNPSTYVAKLHTYLDPSDSKKSRKHTNLRGKDSGSDGTSTQVNHLYRFFFLTHYLLSYSYRAIEV